MKIRNHDGSINFLALLVWGILTVAIILAIVGIVEEILPAVGLTEQFENAIEQFEAGNPLEWLKFFFTHDGEEIGECIVHELFE